MQGFVTSPVVTSIAIAYFENDKEAKKVINVTINLLSTIFIMKVAQISNGGLYDNLFAREDTTPASNQWGQHVGRKSAAPSDN